MSDLNKMGLAQARDALRSGETTSKALTEACLGAIDAAGALNAFVHHTPELAMERAAAADERVFGRFGGRSRQKSRPPVRILRPMLISAT